MTDDWPPLPLDAITPVPLTHAPVVDVQYVAHAGMRVERLGRRKFPDMQKWHNIQDIV